MAYIIGLVSAEEKKELEARGWEIEDAPQELIPKEPTSKDMIMVWVDSDLFKIMSGPDWDRGTSGRYCPACKMLRPLGQVTGAHMSMKDGKEFCCFGEEVK